MKGCKVSQHPRKKQTNSKTKSMGIKFMQWLKFKTVSSVTRKM